MEQRQWAIVTGANGGIGIGIARALHERYSLVLLYHRERDQVDRLVAEFGADQVRAVACDLRSLEEIEAAYRELAGLDIAALVNNAGKLTRRTFLDMPMAEFDDVLNLDLRGPYRLTQLVARGMVASGHGSIVNIASAATQVASAYLGAYGIAKSAVLMFTRILAQELGPSGIRANSVSPGLIRTPINEKSYQDPEMLRQRVERSAVKRVGLPEDIGAVVAFLCGPSAGFLTGQNIVVDGGSHDSMLANASWVRETVDRAH